MVHSVKIRFSSIFNGYKPYCVVILLSIGFISCSKTSTSVGDLSLEESWQWQGFEDASVTVLVEDADDRLLIGTENGLFMLKEGNFISLGLTGQEIRGVVRLTDNSLLAGVKASDLSSGDSTLFRSQNEGGSWQHYVNNFGGNEGKYTSILHGPLSAHTPSDTIFTGGGAVARSTDAGQNWEVVLGNWDNITGIYALYIDPHQPGVIWAGGVTSLSQAYLYKSDEYGDGEWVSVTGGLSDNTEAVAYDVITHSENPDWVLAGLGGAITESNKVKKSIDGGTNWKTALEETGIHSFTRSIRDPAVIYGSGRDSSTKLFYAVTDDFGETWEKEIFEEWPSPVTTHDIAVMTIEGREVMFFGSDQGLFSYTFAE